MIPHGETNETSPMSQVHLEKLRWLRLPFGNFYTLLLKMSIYSGFTFEFTHLKWGFSIVMLVYQRVSTISRGLHNH